MAARSTRLLQGGSDEPRLQPATANKTLKKGLNIKKQFSSGGPNTSSGRSFGGGGSGVVQPINQGIKLFKSINSEENESSCERNAPRIDEMNSSSKKKKIQRLRRPKQ